MQEDFTESEVIRTVTEVTKSGAFREMLTNKCAHIRDKSSTEAFQELSNTWQQNKESLQQFMWKTMGLKQCFFLFESQQPHAEFSYDKKFVQGTFLHTFYERLNEKVNHVWPDLKPHRFAG